MKSQMRCEIEQAAITPAEIAALTGEQSFRFSSAFVGFSGHFPGYPILPAVLQVLAAQLVAEQIAGEPLQVVSLTRAKFIRQLRPDEKIDVSLECRDLESALRCQTTLRVGDEKAASFTLTLRRGSA